MDAGPYRQPRPTQGRVAGRPEAAQQVHEQPQQVAADPRAVHHRAVATHHKPAKHASWISRFKIPLIVAGSLLVLIVGGLFAWSKINAGSAIDSSKYQAIFFTNGQVYFGKLQTFNSESMKLKDVFYLQTQTGSEASTEELQKTATDQNNVQLIKLGDEIHGPVDEMIISKDQLLFYENLKTDGKVAKSIDQYKKSNP